MAKQLGRDFFDDKLLLLLIGWLSDDIHYVRKAAADSLRHLSELFGDEWTRGQVLPLVHRLMAAPCKYSQRMTALYAIQVLIQSPALSHQAVHNLLLPLVLSLVSDPVANIRFTVAKTLQVLGKVMKVAAAALGGEGLGFEEVSTAVEKLRRDLDRDVRFFAEQAMDEIKLLHQ